MRASSLALASFLCLLLMSIGAPLRYEPSKDLSASGRAAEIVRLRAHFDSVGVELRASEPAGLTSSQRAMRQRLISWLRDYRHAGLFPRNDRFPDRKMPYFRDSEGVLCAMAYLIDRSGQPDIVDRIALTQNNAYIREVAEDRELLDWLESAGLTLNEAARVQPTYGDYHPPVEDDSVSPRYLLATMVSSGASLTTLGLSLLAPQSIHPAAGVAAGAVGLVAGAVNLDGNEETENAARVNMWAGGAALAVGLYRWIQPAFSDSHKNMTAVNSSMPGISIAPDLISTRQDSGLGLVARITF